VLNKAEGRMDRGYIRGTGSECELYPRKEVFEKV